MKKLFLVANWKSNKTKEEAESWINTFKNLYKNEPQKEVIICPPFTLLLLIKDLINKNNLNIKLGAQTISSFSDGAFTGEINAKQLKELVDYVIIGHSERRQSLKETEKDLEDKVLKAKEQGLKVILCIQGIETPIIESADLFAYEPIFAIGTGLPDTPDNAEEVSRKIKETTNKSILYGGSVKSENVNSFTSKEEIDGVLVGGASLDPTEFAKIIQLA